MVLLTRLFFVPLYDTELCLVLVSTSNLRSYLWILHNVPVDGLLVFAVDSGRFDEFSAQEVDCVLMLAAGAVLRLRA